MKRFAFVPTSPAPFEQRISLSHPGLVGTAPTPPALRQSLDVNLYGFVLGRDTTVRAKHLLRATSGTISPLGTVSLTGFLIIPKSGGANRPAHGLVTISNAEGTVTVRLRGTVTVYKAPVPFASGNLTYRIVSGTNADRGAIGGGPVLYGPGPVPKPDRFLLDFGNFPPPP
jgi:hypothetical protein